VEEAPLLHSVNGLQALACGLLLLSGELCVLTRPDRCQQSSRVCRVVSGW